MRQEPVSITGLWFRQINGIVSVLIERDGKWFKVISQSIDEIREGTVSHIIEPLGLLKAKPDDLERLKS